MTSLDPEGPGPLHLLCKCRGGWVRAQAAARVEAGEGRSRWRVETPGRGLTRSLDSCAWPPKGRAMPRGPVRRVPGRTGHSSCPGLLPATIPDLAPCNPSFGQPHLSGCLGQGTTLPLRTHVGPELPNLQPGLLPGSLSITNSRSLPKPMSIESVMPSSHLILCCPLLLLPSIFPSIRVFSNESALRIRWPKYQSFSFTISPSNEHPGLISFMDWLDLIAVQGTLKSLLQHHSSKASIFSAQLSLYSNSHIHT